MTRQRTAYLELALAMALAGSSFPAARVVTEEMPVFLSSAIRYGLAALMLLPLLVRRGGGLPRLTRRELGSLVALAFAGLFGFSILLLYGLRYTTASDAGIISGTTPAVVGILSTLILRERMRPALAVAVGLAVTGMIAMTLAGGSSEGSAAHRGLGNLLIVGTVLCEATFSIIGKSVAVRLGSLVTSTLVTVFGFALFVPLGAVQAVTDGIGGASAWAWFALGYYAVATVLAYLLWYDGLPFVPASAAGVSTGLMPVSAVVLGVAVLGESAGWAHVAGIACVIAALGVTVRSTASDPLALTGVVAEVDDVGAEGVGAV